MDNVDLNFLTPVTDFNQRNGDLFLVNSASLDVGGNFNIGFNASSNVTLSSDSDAMTGTVRIFEGTVDLSGTGTTWISSNQFGVGRAGGRTGTLNISAGAQVTSVEGLIGNETSATGNVLIDGVGSQWEATGSNFLIGNQGSADVDITGGGALVTNTASAGIMASGSATIDVDGTGSTWTTTGDIYLGGSDSAAGGTATLNLTNGGLATVSGNTKLWGGATLNVDGGTFEADNSFSVDPNGVVDVANGTLSVGSFTGRGDVNVNSGGLLTVDNGPITVDGGSLVFAPGSSALLGSGTKSVTNGGLLDLSPFGFVFGNNTTLNATSGGTIKIGSTIIGVGDGATLNVDGGTFEADNSFSVDPNGVVDVANGTLSVGSFTGRGDVNINSGGLASVSGTTKLWSGGTLNLNGGTLATDTFDNTAGGSFNFTSGTLQFTGAGGLDVDPNGDLGASVAVTSGQTIAVDNRITITTVGTLDVSGGGMVTNHQGFIGDQSGSTGAVTVAGSGSTWSNSSNLFIGNAGNGTLEIFDGGSVSNNDGTIGDDPNSTGMVLVEDAGSTWTTTGELYVGREGNGELRIESGGSVVSTRSWIAQADSGSTGEVTVTGSDPNGNASTWTHGELLVGSQGNGTLRVEFGAIVNSNLAYVGRFPGSVGDATVIGSDGSNVSTWNVTSSLTVGDFGDGTLLVQTGADVASSTGIIADHSDSTSVVAVIGNGSTWTNTSSLIIGNSGNGTLNVQSGAAVANSTGIIADDPNSTGVVTMTNNSTWTNSSSLMIGNSGNGTLNVQSGAAVANSTGTIADVLNSISAVTVTGSGSTWTNSGGLFVGNEGVATLNINSSGLVTVAGTTRINPSSSVQLGGGRFELGTTDPNSYGRISGTSGELAGGVLLSGFNAISSIDLTIPNLDVSGVLSANTGVIYGSGVVVSGLGNQATGELRTLAGEWARFGGVGNTNAGEVNNFGGVVEFENDFTNQATGFVAGRGQFIAGTGWTNHGVMVFSGGPAEVLGDVANSATGQISIGGTSVTTFYDDVTMDPNNLNINVAASGTAVFLGSYNGGNDGTGAVEVLGDLRPGNSPAVVSFGGDLNLGSGADTFIELGGLLSGEFDALDIAGDFSIDGDLLVSLLGGFSLDTGMEFLIADVDGTVTGTFNGFADGDLVGNFGGEDLFIDYDAGDGNDIALFTAAAGLAGDFDFNGRVDGLDFLLWQTDPSVGNLSDWENNYGTVASSAAVAAVPEPATCTLGLMLLCFAMSQRRI